MNTRRTGRKMARALVPLAVAAASLLVTPMAPTAMAAEHPDCAIWAELPVLGAGVVTGTGVRDGCVQDRTVTVRLRKDISFWPDETLASRTRSGVVNVTLTAAWDCVGHEGGVIFTEIYTNAGGKAQSQRRSITCNEF